MARFDLKSALRQAQQDEKNGRVASAAQLYGKIGFALYRSGKIEQSRELFRRAAVLLPDSAKYYLFLAMAELGLGKDRDAKEAVRKLTRIVSQRKEIPKYIALMEQDFESYPILRQYFYEMLLEIDRTQLDYFIHLTRAYFDTRELLRAQATALEGLRNFEYSKRLVALLSSILETRGFADVPRLLEQYLSKKLSWKDLVNHLREPKRANPPSEMPEPEEKLPAKEPGIDTMIRELEKELGFHLSPEHKVVTPLLAEFESRSEEILGQDSHARIDIAVAYLQMELYPQAREQLTKIEWEDPLYLQARCLSAECLIKEGSFLGALEVLQAILRDDRREEAVTMQAQYLLVQTYLRLGEPEKAYQVLTDLVSKHPDYRDSRKLKFNLQSTLKRKKAAS